LAIHGEKVQHYPSLKQIDGETPGCLKSVGVTILIFVILCVVGLVLALVFLGANSAYHHVTHHDLPSWVTDPGNSGSTGNTP
jgi:hypothetical protein